MTVLWITLLLVFVLAFFSRYSATTNGTLSYSFVMPNKFLIGCVTLILILVAGLRNNIGDTYFYMHSYELGTFTWETIFEDKDPGFGILQMILKSITSDPQILIFITACITNLLIVITLYKYTRMIELSLYVYITSGMYIVSMNGVRQFLAASIIFCATKYLLNGNIKKYFLLVFLASTLHLSALILLPIYFLVRRKAWSKMTFALLALSVFIVLGFNQFSELLFSTLEGTQYGGYNDFQEGGANIIRVAVNCVPLFLVFLAREKLHSIWPKSDYIVNMSVISTMFTIISAQNWIFARFNIFFGLYNLILISWLVVLFKENNKKYIYYSIIICYLLYYVYEQVLTLNIIYTSDYLKL
ncbi:EpsG family protein [Metabacillus idriensis]|uniref:EpsG family protein n=1 Tax=Metabacillus idriensis TaxID=324768 RepID=UPI00174EA7B5|nr:EpsG family protein [Metabacillus idriensis]